MRIKIFIMTAAMAALVSCNLQNDLPSIFRSDDAVELEVDMVSETVTKSSVRGDYGKVQDWNLFAYLDGNLVLEHYSGNGDRIRLIPDCTYHFYVLANTGEVHAPSDEDDVEALEYRVEGKEDVEKHGIPMCCTKEYSVKGKDKSISFALTKLVARYDLEIDLSGLEKTSFELSSVAICQSALNIFPFRTGSAATETGDFDFASSEDVNVLRAGGTVSFYMLENCQGVLLPGNDDEWKKVPENIKGKESLCTYLSVRGAWEKPGQTADVEYRMYLGKDNVSDFDIERNKAYSVTLSLTDDGASRTSWRVDKTNVKDLTFLRFAKSRMRVFYTDKSERAIRIIARPEGVGFKLLWDRDEADDKRVIIRSDGNCLYAKAPNVFYEDSIKVYLCTEDDRVMDVATIHAVSGEYYSYFLDEGIIVGPGRQLYPEMRYGPNLSTARACTLLSSDNEDVARASIDKKSDPFVRFDAVSPGLTTIRMDNSGFEETVNVYVTPAVLSFEGMPSSGQTFEMKVGESKTFHLSTYPVNEQESAIRVSSEGSSIYVSDISPVTVEHYGIDDVDYGTMYKGVDFTIRANSTGTSVVKCSLEHPLFQSSFYVNVVSR
ncbi:MAG: DUF4906 domain-containing protein [Bacteroidales bacterium]|nr:DUF4906 domain-containing protein [Bacteroidales bacterium]